MNFLITLCIAVPLALFFLRRYVRRLTQNEEHAWRMVEAERLGSATAKGMHPHIDPALCIGCGSCTTVCPEGDVLALAGGKAVIANLQRCIGHERCAEACPMGAITMIRSSLIEPGTPRLTDDYETTIENLFIVGELGGLPLIRNAVNQGRQCIDIIAKRLSRKRLASSIANIYDVVIVGAGPAGISASLRAIEQKLSYITIEADEVGGTVAKFPRHKVVTTTPLEFPIFGKLDRTELPKEHLLAFWDMILNRADFNVCADSKVLDVRKSGPGVFCVKTATRQYWARTVVLATGRAGNPKKLGIPGEHLSKVMYRLIEAEHYTNRRVLVVGGGDSAVEAALALSRQQGNKVTISYRRQEFARIKKRNAQSIGESVHRGVIEPIFESIPTEITNDSVALEVGGISRILQNDLVWIFAGGVPPHEFLNRIGVDCWTPSSETSHQRASL